MHSNYQQKKVIAALLGFFFLTFGQFTSAHTTIADSAIMEGERVYTAATIPHGCNGAPIRSQSILFPTGKNPVAVDQNGNAVDLADHFVSVSHSGEVSPLEPGSGVPMSPRFVQDKNVFRTIVNNSDSDGTRVGVTYDFGYLQSDLTAWIPFRMQAPHFASESCADSVAVRIPILNGCNKSSTAEDRVDAWVGRLTPKYNDPGVVSVNFWPTVTTSRDLENNPLPDSCTETLQLDVSPNDHQIDTYLGVPGYWPNI